jgi:vitamin K-dependent gamma-carboxylase
LDKSIYNNHIYLFILLALLLSFTDADRSLSIRKNSSLPATIPRWQQFILQFQIVIAYFFGGIAKTGHDWLFNCQPVKLLVENLPKTHLLAPILKNEAGVLFLNYGGFLIDFGAPFILWYKPFRKWGIVFIVLFHIFNSIIFTDIGVFPFVMMVSLILFFEISELPVLRNVTGKFAKRSLKKDNKTVPIVSSHLNTGTFVFLIIYFVFQILFPLRGYFLPNDMDWTTIGNRFSWRMKVDTRQINEMTFTLIDPVRRDSIPVEIQTFVNDMQILNMSMDPRSVADFAKMLKVTAGERGLKDAEVITRIKVSYNGREPQLFVKPDIDMTEVGYSPFKTLNWIYPVPD